MSKGKLKESGLMILAVIAVIDLLYGLIWGITIPYHTKDSLEITVVEKERTYSGGASYYLIFTDEEVFKNSDSILHGKFDSSDMYVKLKEGKEYKITVYGYRVPLLSWYRNIIAVEEIK